MSSALDLFHPLVAEWFSGTLGEPTDIQSQAWPCIAQGKHVFVTAPTGSGKTLTAFLHAINNLIVEAGAADKPPRRGVRGSQVLYISPLKALNNDIERNLNSPLFQLSRLFSERGLPFPQIQVMVRSGDTPQNDRRRMLRSPPQILITTPESLNVLLTTDGGRRVLADVRTVILDEIHNTAGSKRGTYLMTAVERLACEFGEFQRIALSATVRPLEATARFVAGYRLIHSPGGSPRFEPRPIEILAAPHTKAYDVRVAFPEGAGRQTDAEGWWSALVAGFRRIVSNNRSTIFFTNSRRMSEKVTRLMNEGLEKDIAYAHHGSLSREIRLAVEERLKSGELPAIVATSSLELGIDIGEVDQVVLVQTPTEPSSAIQRIGRAGHGVGQVSRGTFHPIHKRDFIDAAVALQCVLERSLEEVRIPRAPLDVLAQVVLAMCLERSRPADELYAIVRTCSAYHELERRSFDLVIDMLTGRYADRRIRELRPRLVRDGAGGELRSLAAVRSLIYMSGGVIPDRGYFNLRTADSKEKVGELDEEFVWERSIGDVFPMGNHLWRIVQITHNDVEVAPANRSPVTVPFWRADEQNRGFFFSEKVGAFLERAAAQLDSPPFLTELANGGLDEGAALSIVDFLKDQRTESGMGLPHRHRVTVEVYGGARGQKGQQTVIHTFWGGKVNRPFSLLIAASLEMETGARVAVFHNKDSVLVNSRDEFQLELVLRSIAPERILSMLREKLESTAFFGALFRQNAQRALLIPRRGFKQRMPLWLSRVRAKRLFDAVSTATDFPILAETWQECLSSEFELGTLVGLLEELADGRIAVEQRRVERPSPLARELIWQETNDLMYANDAPEATVRSLLDDELVRAAAAELGEKWIIPEETVDLLRGHLERTASGYAPADWPDLLSHLDERQWVPRTEWLRLLQAVRAEQGEEAATAMLEALSSRVVWHNAMSGAEQALATGPSGPGWGTVTRAALAQVSAVLSLFQSRPSAERVLRFLAQWAAAPVRIEAQTLVEAFHLEAGIAERLLSEASAAGLLQKASFGPAGVPGLLVPENLERLLRLRRTARRVQSSVLELDRLPLFLARLHGMSREEPGPAADPGTGELQAAMEALFAFPGHAELWESEYLPARCGSYKSTDLDELLRDSGLLWCGFGNRRVRFVLEDDMDLLEEPEALMPASAGGSLLGT